MLFIRKHLDYAHFGFQFGPNISNMSEDAHIWIKIYPNPAKRICPICLCLCPVRKVTSVNYSFADWDALDKLKSKVTHSLTEWVTRYWVRYWGIGQLKIQMTNSKREQRKHYFYSLSDVTNNFFKYVWTLMSHIKKKCKKLYLVCNPPPRDLWPRDGSPGTHSFCSRHR